jgi:mannose-6-phosphate isomerase-like protein (cupin superfamily)
MAESTFAMIKTDFGGAIRGTGESKRSGMEVARREGGEVEGTLGERAPLVR